MLALEPLVLMVCFSTQKGVLEYLSAFDEEPPKFVLWAHLPLVQEEEAVSELEPDPKGCPEACDGSELADGSLAEGTMSTESSHQEPPAGLTHLSSLLVTAFTNVRMGSTCSCIL